MSQGGHGGANPYTAKGCLYGPPRQSSTLPGFRGRSGERLHCHFNNTRRSVYATPVDPEAE